MMSEPDEHEGVETGDLNVETSKHRNVETPKLQNVETSKDQDVQTSKRQDVEALRADRVGERNQTDSVRAKRSQARTTRHSGTWGYALGATTVFLFVLQVVTGLMLMTVYSPSATTAWASVWYIQSKMPAGWLIRSLHHFASDAMLIVLATHLTHMVAVKAYRTRHPLIWCSTLLLGGVTLALSLSGHLLPWDQEGYWGTKVRVNILARTPEIGELLQRFIVGGVAFGHLMLTRVYTLHIMILPAVAVLLFRLRKGRDKPCVDAGSKRNEADSVNSRDAVQRLRNTATCALALALVGGVAWYVCSVRGSHLLDAPADPGASSYPARPEWHTLFLYQWLKYFVGPKMEVIGAVIIPSALGALWLLLPYWSRILPERVAHRFTTILAGCMVLGVGFLSAAALWADINPSDLAIREIRDKQADEQTLTARDEDTLRARSFNIRRDRARRRGQRAIELADALGVPPEGPLALLANDPQTRGPELFAANCATCHRFDGHDGLGAVPPEAPDASDLAGYAGRRWIRGLLAEPMNDRYFGLMKNPDGDPAHTRMRRFVAEAMEDVVDDAAREALLADFDAVAAYLEDESQHPRRLAHIGAADDADDGTLARPNTPAPIDAQLERGRRFFMSTCNECHTYDGEQSGTLKAPEMAGYGSVEWITLMIAEPSHPTRYRARGRERARMTGFSGRLSDRDIRLIAQWIHDSQPVAPTKSAKIAE